jgi:hypothetical protein
MRRKPIKLRLVERVKTNDERLLEVRRTVAEGVSQIAVPHPLKRKRRLKGLVAVVIKPHE